MNKQSGRIGLYLVLIVMLIGGYFYLSNQVSSQSNYTMQGMERAAKEGKIVSARIHQNREVPTGSVTAQLSGEGQKRVYVTDVNEAKEMLKENGVDVEVSDVPQENTLLTALLPVLISVGQNVPSG